MSARASDLCDAEYGRGHRRPGELEKRLPAPAGDTRAGTIHPV